MQITLTNPLDMHIHFRDHAMLEVVAPYTTKSFVAGVVMPNLNPPITSVALAKSYMRRIQSIDDCFFPICPLYFHEDLSFAELQQCVDSGLRILKLYPKGATTGSEKGVSQILSKKTLEICSIAQDLGMILSIHGESNGFMLDREYEFGEIFASLAHAFPHLKIIIEHMSDHRSIPLLREFKNIYATLTLHHITLDLDSVVGGKLEPHHFCKPTLKTPTDKQKLLELALSADPKVSFGSDSAPHTLESKRNGAAGIFSAPCLLEKLTELFETHNALSNLQAFVSDNAMRNYCLSQWLPPLRQKQITLTKSPQTIPESIDSKDSKEDVIIPFHAGKTIKWSIKQICEV